MRPSKASDQQHVAGQNKGPLNHGDPKLNAINLVMLYV